MKLHWFWVWEAVQERSFLASTCLMMEEEEGGRGEKRRGGLGTDWGWGQTKDRAMIP